MKYDGPQTGTLMDVATGATVVWQLVEFVPYEPSAYHWDEGIIVCTRPTEQHEGNLYFISLMSGTVFDSDKQEADETDAELTHEREDLRCPEISALIAKFITDMEIAFEGKE